MLADRYGTGRVIAAAGLIYTAGLLLMTVSSTPLMAHLSIGVFTGFAMSGAMFPIILSAISQAVTPEKRDFYLGIASAGGSSGQVIMIPLGQFFIDSQGWVFSLYMMSIMTLLIVPLAFVMVRKSADEPAAAVAHQAVALQSARHLPIGATFC